MLSVDGEHLPLTSFCAHEAIYVICKKNELMRILTTTSSHVKSNVLYYGFFLQENKDIKNRKKHLY